MPDICTPKRGASGDTIPDNSLISDFESKKKKFCCFNYPFCDILLWQPEGEGDLKMQKRKERRSSKA
jgi:hypothetical protein